MAAASLKKGLFMVIFLPDREMTIEQSLPQTYCIFFRAPFFHRPAPCTLHLEPFHYRLQPPSFNMTTSPLPFSSVSRVP
jgi:hypothetical protein